MKNRGFTIIELLVTMAIMVLLTSVVLANFGGTSARRNVGYAKDVLASNVRRMQSYSLSSKDIYGIPSVSYGVHVASIGSSKNSTSYDLVGYNNAGSGRTVLETDYLPANVYISRITVLAANGNSTTTTDWQTNFNNPYARITQTYTGTSFSGNSEENDITTITITSSDGSYSTSMVINGASGVVSE